MTRVLVAYTTNAGSTTEVAQAIGDELSKRGFQADVLRLEEVSGVAGYDSVIVGAPMIVGWSGAAQKFVRKHRDELAKRPIAYFSTLMNLTQLPTEEDAGIPVRIDPWLAAPPKNPQRLSIKERYASLSNYLGPMLKPAPEIHPMSVAFFGGKLELFRLKWWQMLFVMIVIRSQPGDRRNWDFIRQWARELDLD